MKSEVESPAAPYINIERKAKNRHIFLIFVEKEEWLSAIEVQELMANLKSISKDLFLLHHFFGYSYVDLARLKQKKVKTIEKVVERARKKMRDQYFGHPTRVGSKSELP